MFAENDRISHRQLYRQIVLSLLAPFLLCLVGWRSISGVNGVIGIVLVIFIMGFYVIFLVRLAPAYEHLKKYVGKTQSVIISIFYVLYLLFTIAYLLELAEDLAGTWLLPEVDGNFIRLAIAAMCAAGSHRGLQKRARMGEVSFWIVVGAFMLLLILAAIQNRDFSMAEFYKGSFQTGESVMATYEILCGFLPFTLLPFLLSGVTKSSGTANTLRGAVLILTILLAAAMVLAPVTLGWERAQAEAIPMLPLLTGTNLPGDILARFDVLWIALFLYSLLYAMGSLFYYGNHILQKCNLPVNHWILAFLAFILSCNPMKQWEIKEYYGELLCYIMAPLLFFVTLYIYIWYRGKRS